jgi:hypothetical protein
MKKGLKILALVVALGALSALFAALPVFAGGPCGCVGAHVPCTEGDMAFAAGLYRLVDIHAVADALALEDDDVSIQLWAGKTLMDMVDESGADLALVRDAVDAERYRALVDADYKRDDRPDLCGPYPCSHKHGYKVKCIAKAGLRLRMGPGTRHAVHRVAPYGTVLYHTGVTKMVGSHEWFECKDGGSVVWAVGRYLSSIH